MSDVVRIVRCGVPWCGLMQYSLGSGRSRWSNHIIDVRWRYCYVRNAARLGVYWYKTLRYTLEVLVYSTSTSLYRTFYSFLYKFWHRDLGRIWNFCYTRSCLSSWWVARAIVKKISSVVSVKVSPWDDCWKWTVWSQGRASRCTVCGASVLQSEGAWFECQLRPWGPWSFMISWVKVSWNFIFDLCVAFSLASLALFYSVCLLSHSFYEYIVYFLPLSI